MGQIFAIANQKGGVGKTTTAINLAAGLAAAEKSVLLIDADTQANASSGLGIGRDRTERHNLYRAMIGECAATEVTQSTGLPLLKVIPGHPDLIGIEIEMVSVVGREQLLKKLLDPLREQYDFIIIDCPPSLGLITLNALVVADGVIIPLQTEYYAMEGLSQLLRTIEMVRASFNPKLQLSGILFTLADPRNRLSREVMHEVRSHFGDTVFQTVIPRNIRLSESPSYGQPIILYDINCRGAEAYLGITSEFLARPLREGAVDTVSSLVATATPGIF